MAETSPTPRTDEPSREQTLVQRWADFTKVLAIYPEANERVQRTLTLALQALEDVLERGGSAGAPLAVLFQGEEIVAGDAVLPVVEGANPEWLKERMDRAALAGVELQRGLDSESFTAFNRRLLELFTRREADLPFAELWPESYPGIVLVPRRFDGAFRASSALDDEFLAEATHVDTSDEESLVRLLLTHPEVVDLLKKIQAHLDARGGSGGARRSVDLLGRIVKFMPVDIAQDYTRVVTLVTRVLEVLDEQVGEAEEGEALSAMRDDGTLRTMLFVVSRSLFSRQESSAAELAERVARGEGAPTEQEERLKGRAGDERVGDDLEAFRTELDGLPAQDGAPLEPGHLDLEDEQLGVYLHFYTRLESGRRRERLTRHVVRLLREPAPASLDVLRAYLEPLWHSRSRSDTAMHPARVLELLRDYELLPLVRRSGALTQERMYECFPRDFGLYLDTLDFESRDDVEELRGLCAQLDAGRIRESAEALWVAECLLDDGRRERFLTVGGEELMPFARVVLEQSSGALRLEVAKFLRRLKLEEAEARPLWLVEDASLLRAEYLQALLEGNGHDPAALRRLAAEEVVRWLDVAAERDVPPTRRAYVVRALKAYEPDVVVPYLEAVCQARRLLVLPTHPAAVRQAAQEVLQALETRRKAR